MSEPTMRGITAADAERVNAFLAEVEAVDHTGEHYNVADIHEELDNPLIDPGRDWVLAELAGEVVGHWRLFPRAPSGGDQVVLLDGAVHPRHRGRGIGELLVAGMVARGLSHVGEQGPLRPILTATGISSNTGQAELFAAAGLRSHRWTFQMEADTTRVTAPLGRLPDGLTLTTYVDADAPAMLEAHNTVFRDHPGFTPWDEQMWQQWVTGSRNFRPALSCLVRDATGAVAAYLQTNEYDAVLETTGRKEAYVAKVGTLREHRGKGLATNLLRHALAAYRNDGFQRASLDVDSKNPTGALGVYERSGFIVTNRWTSYRLEGRRRRSGACPDGSWRPPGTVRR